MVIEDEEEFDLKYRKLYFLGKGAFGKVYAVENRETEETFAAKEVNKQVADLKDYELLEMEKKICGMISSELTHPNLVHIHEIIEGDTLIHIIMEDVDGGDLYDAIKESKRLAEPTAKRWFKQLMETVQFLHINNVVHRDLKPENILIDNRQCLKICDFGFATKLNKPTQKLKRYCGTTSYAPPEIMTCTPYPGPSADIWSCGVILYFMLTGDLPFESEKTEKECRKISRAKFTLPSYISEEASDLIKSMLRKNPKHRITAEDCLLHPWLSLPINSSVKKEEATVHHRPSLFWRIFKTSRQIVPTTSVE